MSFNALNIDFYLCGGIHSKGYAPGEQTTALLQELTAILDRLQSDDYDPNLHTIWLSAKRPTFWQYYEQYYPEMPYDIVDAETEKKCPASLYHCLPLRRGMVSDVDQPFSRRKRTGGLCTLLE